MKYPIPDAALDDRLGWVGTAGSGKSYNAMGRVERLLDRGARAACIDPLGVFWGLRLRPDGQTASGYDIPIFGGPHGDLPLTEHSGALIGETVAGMAESCIIDLSEIGTKAGERRFMLAFLTAIYRNATGDPLHLIIDEADMFAPQKLTDKDGDAARLLGMMETVVRRGRIKGFVPWLITQRPAVIAKDVLSQVDGLVAFKLTSSQDRDALAAWVEGSAEKGIWDSIYKALPAMQRGEGVVWIPGRGVLETVAFPEKHTFDSSRTPKRGETRQSTELRPLDLGALKNRLATVEADTKANDPKALKAEIARLTALSAAAARSQPAADPAAITAAEQRGYSRGFTEAGRQASISFEALKQLAGTTVRTFAESFQLNIRGEKIEFDDTPRLPMTFPARTQTPAHAVPPPAARPPSAAASRDGKLSPTVRKILDVIHRSNPVALSFEAASLRAGVSRRSSAYRAYREQIEASPEVVQRGDGRFTSASGFSQPVGPGIDPIEEFAAKLPPSYARMLRSIAAAAGPVTKEQIAAMADISPTSSGLGAGLSELIALSLVERDETKFAYSIHRDLRS